MAKQEKQQFGSDYYNKDYFVTPLGKKFKTAEGKELGWSYDNQDGEFTGAGPIAKAWSGIFSPKKMLDVGCGRGTFLTYARDEGIEAVGFDFSKWCVSDEGRYPRCDASWVKQHDVTKPFPYKDKEFDLVTALDIFEHLYETDIKQALDEVFRVSKKYVFFQIATINSEKGICFKKGDSIPIEWQGCTVAGHVTIQTKTWWLNQLYREGWKIRKDLLEWFITLVDPAIIANWHQNLMVIMERA
jgi:ubiquinone/menaquinone biosynthesis C-methylase UbiE